MIPDVQATLDGALVDVAQKATASKWWEPYQVSVPPGEDGDWKIVKDSPPEDDALDRIRSLINRDRSWVPPGVYTRLLHRGSVWMSDTPDEISDHRPAIRQIELRGGRVLINGLGIGLVVQAALQTANVDHVDVVEIEPAVIRLVGPHYERMAAETGTSLTIHEADAYEIRWPVGTRWDVAWHDIWSTISTENLEGMARLKRRYGRRVDWQGAWAQEDARYERRRYG